MRVSLVGQAGVEPVTRGERFGITDLPSPECQEAHDGVVEEFAEDDNCTLFAGRREGRETESARRRHSEGSTAQGLSASTPICRLENNLHGIG
jgi:hypothetical protein